MDGETAIVVLALSELGVGLVACLVILQVYVFVKRHLTHIEERLDDGH